MTTVPSVPAGPSWGPAAHPDRGRVSRRASRRTPVRGTCGVGCAMGALFHSADNRTCAVYARTRAYGIVGGMSTTPHRSRTWLHIGLFILAIVLLAVVVWFAIRGHTGAPSTAAPTASATVSASASADAPDATAPVSAREVREANAVRFEQLWRTYGADSTIDPKEFAHRPAKDVLNALRVTDYTPPDWSAVSTIQRNSDYGPTGSNPACQGTTNSFSCMAYPTVGEWWVQQAWGSGSRWIEGPTVEHTGEHTATVTGVVRAILVEPGDTFHSTDTYALTPSWQDYPVSDELTFDTDGKVSEVSSNQPSPWWVSPWNQLWDTNMNRIMANGRRVAIPVQGQPVMDINPTQPVMRAPATQADLDGKVDWSLWEGMCMASCGDQQQGFTVSPDGREH